MKGGTDMRKRFSLPVTWKVVAAILAVAVALSAGQVRASNLMVETLEVSFQGGDAVKVLTRGESLKAVADLVFKGSGVLSGIWEIAEPAPGGEAGNYRSLTVVSKDLSATKREKIWSPELPSGSTGTYALRFRITRPVPKKEAVVRYFVGELPSDEVLGGKTSVPDAIATRSPSAAVGRETTFSWDPVPGSVGYQVEIYDETGQEKAVVVEAGTFGTCLVRHPSDLNRPPLVGLMAPGYQTEATLSQLAGSTLESGNAYLWRVVALGQRGKVLCESPFRKFTYSE